MLDDILGSVMKVASDVSPIDSLMDNAVAVDMPADSSVRTVRTMLHWPMYAAAISNALFWHIIVSPNNKTQRYRRQAVLL